MEAIITIQGMDPIKNPKAPVVFVTDQGKFRAWPLVGDDTPNPIVHMFQNGILQTFKVTYTEKPWTNQQGVTINQKYVESAELAPPAAGIASAEPQGTSATPTQPAPAVNGGAPVGDIRTTVDGHYRSPMMSYVSDVVAGAMRSGKFGATEIGLLTNAALSAWHEIPAREAKRREYATDTDEYSQTHDRPIHDEPQGDAGYPEQR